MTFVEVIMAFIKIEMFVIGQLCIYVNSFKTKRFDEANSLKVYITKTPQDFLNH